LAKTTVYRR